MATRGGAQGHLAREGALGVGGGEANHEETGRRVGGDELTNAWIVKSLHLAVNAAGSLESM
jgi:hypothetical protein